MMLSKMVVVKLGTMDKCQRVLSHSNGLIESNSWLE